MLRPTRTPSYSYCRDASGCPRPCPRASARDLASASTSASTLASEPYTLEEPRRSPPAHCSSTALKKHCFSDVSALTPSPGTTKKQWSARGLKIRVSWWHAAATMAIRAVSTPYCRATAESVSIISFIGSAEAPLSLVSKERRHLVQHNLRDRRTRPSLTRQPLRPFEKGPGRLRLLLHRGK